MPVSAYFKGKGESVLAQMIREYGKKKGTRIFYAVANEKGLTPAKKKRKVKR